LITCTIQTISGKNKDICQLVSQTNGSVSLACLNAAITAAGLVRIASCWFGCVQYFDARDRRLAAQLTVSCWLLWLTAVSVC